MDCTSWVSNWVARFGQRLMDQAVSVGGIAGQADRQAGVSFSCFWLRRYSTICIKVVASAFRRAVSEWRPR